MLARVHNIVIVIKGWIQEACDPTTELLIVSCQYITSLAKKK